MAFNATDVFLCDVFDDQCVFSTFSFLNLCTSGIEHLTVILVPVIFIYLRPILFNPLNQKETFGSEYCLTM